MTRHHGFLVLIFVTGICPASASGATVHELCDLSTPATAPFPNGQFTVPDFSQNTRIRVNLPKPDCTARRSDCEDIDVLNTLDGFSLQPRLSIPFDGTVDVRTVTSDTVYLVNIGNTLIPPIRQQQRRIGINRVLWDPDTLTLIAEPDEILEQHTRYALVVTSGVRDADGHPIVLAPTCATTFFTTRSVTAILERIRDQIKAGPLIRADLLLGPGGTATVFPLDQIQDITFARQTAVHPPQFSAAPLAVRWLNLVPGAVGQLAFGKFVAPDYMAHPGEFIPPVGTRGGTPPALALTDIYFNLYLPAGRRPTGGWPVAIFSQPANTSKDSALNIAATLAAHGLATIAINHMGHGGGPLSTLTVTLKNGASVTFSAGGREIDQTGSGVIPTRTDGAASPRTVLLFSDGIRQTVADTMQLVRLIEAGIDVDGDWRSDLDARRIYSVGASLGSAVSMLLMAVEPDVRAGAFISPAGPNVENFRLSPVNRTPNLGNLLAARVPSLINTPGVSSLGGVSIAGPFFNENRPLRDQPPVINTITGAMAIQIVLDRLEWASEAGNPNAYVRHLRGVPLEGVPKRSVIVQIGKGDQNAPSLNASQLIMTGDLVNRTLYYRHDVAFAENRGLPKDPHVFTLGLRGQNLDAPGVAPIALAAQEQIGVFFESDGNDFNQPQPIRYFESPIRLPLPDAFNYIP